MEIKKCTAKDLPALSDFYDSVVLYLTEHINYPKWRYKDYPSCSSVHSAICEGSQYICVDGNSILGAFVFNENPQGAYDNGDWRKKLSRGDYLVIHTLAVDVNSYGKGIGKYMVEFCIKNARARGYKAIRLDVVPGNEPAIRLYKKMGFAFAGEKDLERGFNDIPTFMLYELNF